MTPAEADALALEAELLFPRFDGRVLDRGDHIEVRTPRNPGYRWGNFLYFHRAPEPLDVPAWEAAFESAFPDADHRAIGWAGSAGRGAADAFIERGYAWKDEILMVADAGDLAVPPGRGADVEIRITRSTASAEWDAFLGLNRAWDPIEAAGDPAYGAFKSALRSRYGEMLDAGSGWWLTAWSAGRVVGSFGVFEGADYLRLQAVETHPDHRGRGVCTRLVGAGLVRLLGESAVKRAVLLAEPGGAADRIYARLGFRVRGVVHGVERAPDSPGSIT